MVDHDPSAHDTPAIDTPSLDDYYRENGDALNEAFFRLKNIYGLNGTLSVQAHTLPEYLYRKYLFSHSVPEGEDLSYYKKMEGIYVANATTYIRDAIRILKDEHGVDILGSKQPIKDRDQYVGIVRSFNEITGYNLAGREIQDEQAVYIFATDIAHLYAGNKDTYRAAIANTHKQLRAPGLTLPQQAAMFAQESFYMDTVKNLGGMRYDARRDFKELCGDNITALIDFADEVERRVSMTSRASAQGTEMATEILQSKTQELDYTILPAGTELRDVAQSIVDDSTEYTKAHIDLERLAVLEDIRQWFGPDKCYLMRGKSTGKGMKDADGTLISEDYIGLIMQHHDEDGVVASEDCLAISPIARKHAGYLVRQDASAGISWREILSIPKSDALEYFNARRLRFDPVAGEDKYAAYTKKAQALLTCDSEQFGREYVLKRRKDGEYTMAHRGKSLAGQSIQAAALLGALDL